MDFNPNQIRHAYGFDQVGFLDSSHAYVPGDGRGTTIAIVDWNDDPTIASDLATFDTHFGIPAPPSFTKVDQRGGTNYPTAGNETEITLDVEYAHAMAPGANILLVEADSNNSSNTDIAVQYAANQPGVVAVSNSYGSSEYNGETSRDSIYTHAGVTYLSSTGDNGAPGEYPACSPNMVAVGGTVLNVDGSNNWSSESGWSGSGGGISQQESQPAYQNGVVTQSTTRRTTPDLAFNATNVTIYDTSGGSGYYGIGGTSLSCPVAAGLVALVNQGRSYLNGLSSYSGSAYLNALYHLADNAFHDITTGSNQTVSGVIINDGGTGYAQPTMITFTGGGATQQATGTVITSHGAVIAINIDSNGSGYTSAPTVTISGGGGTGATGVATIAGGRVTGVTITNGGAGYLSVDFGGGGGSGATGVATIAGGRVTGVTITNGGLGYISAPTVTFTFGGGSGGTGTATLVGGLAGPGYDLVTGRGTPIVPRFVAGMTGDPVYDANTGKLLIVGGGRDSNDTITLDTSGNLLNVSFNLGNPVPGNGRGGSYTESYTTGTFSSLEVDTTDGGNLSFVNVNRTPNVPLKILSDGEVLVTLGTGGSAQGVLGSVIFAGTANAATAVTVDDSADGATHSVTVRDGDANTGEITGLTPQPIFYDYTSTGSISLDTGTGTNTVNVQDIRTGSNLNLVGNSNATTVNIGTGDTHFIYAGITVTNPHYFTTLTVDDSTDSGNRTATVGTWYLDNTYGQINGLFASASSSVYFKYSDTNSVTVYTGTGAEVVNVTAVVRPLTLYGNSNDTTVNVGNNNSMAGIGNTLTVHNPRFYTTLNLNDSADTANRTVTLTSTGVTGLSPSAISFLDNDLKALTVNGGGGANTYTVTSTSSNFNYVSTTMNTGGGLDTVFIKAADRPLTVTTTTGNGGGGNDQVTIGNAGSLAGITAAVTINNTPSHEHLTVDDSADATNRVFTISSSGITVPSLGALNFMASSVNNLIVSAGSGANSYTIVNTPAASGMTLNTGSGADIVNVQNASAPLTISTSGGFGGNGNDQVAIGNAGSLAGITAAITVTNIPSYDHLTLDDSADSASRTVTIGNTSVTGLSPAAVTWDSGSINTLTVNGGRGANTYTVNAPIAYQDTTLNTGSGNGSTVNVQATTHPLAVNLQNTLSSVNIGSTANSLDPIQAAVSLSGLAAALVRIMDQGTSVAQTYTVGASSLTRTGAAAINYTSVFSLTLNGGSGGNTINVQANPALTVNAGAGNNTVNTINVGSATNSLDSILGTVSINGQGGANVLYVNDQGTITAQTYHVQTAIPSIQRGQALVAYSGMSILVLRAGSGGNTIDVLGTLAATPVTVYAGALNDTVNVGDSGNHLDSIQSPMNVYGQNGTTLLNVNDQGTATSTTYGITDTFLGRTGSPAITYSNLNSLTLNGGSGGNTINVESTAAGTTTTVNGGSGGSTINLSRTAHDLVNLHGLVNINGQGQSNMLYVYDQATTFLQGYQRAENLYQDHLAWVDNDEFEHTVFTYSGMQSVNVDAGCASGGENFGVRSTPAGVPVTVTDEGAGMSSVLFIVRTIYGQLSDIQGPLTLHGRAGGDDIIDSLDDSQNPSFETYTVTASTVTRTDMNGNPDMAPIVYDNVTRLILAGSSGGNVFHVPSVPSGTALGLFGGGTNTLQGPDSDTVWQITSRNTGSFTGGVSFTSMQNLTGGMGADTFQFANGAGVDGTIDGGGGTNTLDYSAYASSSVVVDLALQTPLATGVGGSVANIENITAASGGGNRGLYNLLIGNGGNTLTGGFGRRNILVAGGSASTLNAGDGEDLLIGGSTVYDTDPALASWLQIAAYWAGTDDYFTRVATLTTPGSGVPILDPTAGTGTVFGNGGGNTMNGNGNLALIYSDGYDTISGFDPNYQTVTITP
jgi:acrosin